MSQVKRYERLTVAAVVEGSYLCSRQVGYYGILTDLTVSLESALQSGVLPARA